MDRTIRTPPMMTSIYQELTFLFGVQTEAKEGLAHFLLIKEVIRHCSMVSNAIITVTLVSA